MWFFGHRKPFAQIAYTTWPRALILKFTHMCQSSHVYFDMGPNVWIQYFIPTPNWPSCMLKENQIKKSLNKLT